MTQIVIGKLRDWKIVDNQFGSGYSVCSGILFEDSFDRFPATPENPNAESFFVANVLKVEGNLLYTDGGIYELT